VRENDITAPDDTANCQGGHILAALPQIIDRALDIDEELLLSLLLIKLSLLSNIVPYL
jgi:hypothetical protein